MNHTETSVFKANEYEVELTGDQSPTLRLQQKDSMHNRRGAAGESVYIYYEALIRYSLLSNQKRHPKPLSILSFGFGMGYNEILTVLFFLKNNWHMDRLTLFSYEKDLFLYELFNSWLESDTQSGSVYDEVYTSIQRATSAFGETISQGDLKKHMKQLMQNKQWFQGGRVETYLDFSSAYDVVFYDAFSSKLDDCMWTEHFLSELFRTRLNKTFVFSTFACTGALKRVAAAYQAHFEKRVGYKGKRNASIIFRDN